MTRHRDGGVRELRFRAETVTPLFMAGAVPGGPEAELRAPSVRGALRFWFRAGMGAAGVTDAKELYRLEAALFGDTRRASRVRRVEGVDMFAISGTSG